MDYDLAKALCTIGVKPPAIAAPAEIPPCSEEKGIKFESVAESVSKPIVGEYFISKMPSSDSFCAAEYYLKDFAPY